MSVSTRLDAALWLVAGAGAVLAVVGWRVAPIASAPVPTIGSAPLRPAMDLDTLSRAASRLAETDPFRLDRRPAALAYQITFDGAAPAPPRPPRPALVLKGIVGAGRPASWVALLDGVPGHGETAVVREGDTLGGLRVRHVGRDTVVVTVTDTTWRLTVRQAWQ
jgi:hypothetical protein